MIKESAEKGKRLGLAALTANNLPCQLLSIFNGRDLGNREQ